jgi:hypothetical protein
MIYFLCFALILAVLFFALKMHPHKTREQIEKELHEKIRNDSTKRIIQSEKEKIERYVEKPLVEKVLMQPKSKTHEQFLDELLNSSYEEVIHVDAELVFKNANLKDNYYLHASHYFPDRELVFGKNMNGKIVNVDLYGRVDAKHPVTGERIPGVKRYLRQNRVE